MTALATLLVLAVAPGVFWLWYFRRRDHLRPEPRHLVSRVFILGALATILAGAIETVGFALTGDHVRLVELFVPASVVAAVFIGIVEESAKLLALYLGVYRHAHFDEVMDGILYAVTVSMGFGTIENIAYVLEGGILVALLRAVLSVPGHAFFGVVMGFYIGVARFAGSRSPRWFALGLILASLSHAAYDAAVFTETWVALLVIPLVLLLGVSSLRYVSRALALDGKRLGRPLAATAAAVRSSS